MRGVEAVFIDIDSHRIRSGWHDDDGELLIVLGQTFTIGSDAHVARRFHDREAWMTTNVPTREIERCGQDAGLPVLQTRYSKDDKVIHGPATKALERAQILVDED